MITIRRGNMCFYLRKTCLVSNENKEEKVCEKLLLILPS
jgi:hypothetical protein